jgi:FixJ family two-component response regulator
MGAVLVGSNIICVVDDDGAVTASLKFLLEIEGYTVSAFLTGSELLSADDLLGCRCLVVDYHMPGMNGIEVIRTARAHLVEHGRRAALPAVLITSDPPDDIRLQAQLAQIVIVEKPFKDGGVPEAVRTLLAAHAR